VLKSNAMPETDESYQYREPGFSQQVCTTRLKLVSALDVKMWKVLVLLYRVP
jgi:hypothetical protein